MTRKRAAPRPTDNQKDVGGFQRLGLADVLARRFPPDKSQPNGQLREDRLKEFRKLRGGRLTRKEKEEFEAYTDEEQEMQLGVIRSFNFHMEMGEWLAVKADRAGRAAGLRSENENRQRKAEHDYQGYREIAGTLIAENPQLRRATPYRLAQKVRAELVKRGRGVRSTRTIWKALRPKNKV